MKTIILLNALIFINFIHAGNPCKPDQDRVDPITKQVIKTWDIVLAGVGFWGDGINKTTSSKINAQFGRYSSQNLLSLFVIVDETSAQGAANNSQSNLKVVMNKKFYLGFSNGDYLPFTIGGGNTKTNVSNSTRYPRITYIHSLSTVLSDSSIKKLNSLFQKSELEVIKIEFDNNQIVERKISGGRNEKLIEIFNCFTKFNEENPIIFKEQDWSDLPPNQNVPEILPRNADNKISFSNSAIVDGVSKEELYNRAIF